MSYYIDTVLPVLIRRDDSDASEPRSLVITPSLTSLNLSLVRAPESADTCDIPQIFIFTPENSSIKLQKVGGTANGPLLTIHWRTPGHPVVALYCVDNPNLTLDSSLAWERLAALHRPWQMARKMHVKLMYRNESAAAQSAAFAVAAYCQSAVCDARDRKISTLLTPTRIITTFPATSSNCQWDDDEAGETTTTTTTSLSSTPRGSLNNNNSNHSISPTATSRNLGGGRRDHVALTQANLLAIATMTATEAISTQNEQQQIFTPRSSPVSSPIRNKNHIHKNNYNGSGSGTGSGGGSSRDNIWLRRGGGDSGSASGTTPLETKFNYVSSAITSSATTATSPTLLTIETPSSWTDKSRLSLWPNSTDATSKNNSESLQNNDTTLLLASHLTSLDLSDEGNFLERLPSYDDESSSF